MSKDKLEELYAEFENMKAESKEKQLRAKELKDEIIEIMDDEGVDEVIINGLDSLVKLSITYPEREVLNKKALADKLDMKQKELSKPQVIIQLTNEGKLTEEMIEEYTVIEEQKAFQAKEYIEEEDE